MAKIVNILAVNCLRILTLMSSVHLIYGVPVDIMVTVAFFYRLLGVSLLGGLAGLVAGWPKAGQSIRCSRAAG